MKYKRKVEIFGLEELLMLLLSDERTSKFLRLLGSDDGHFFIDEHELSRYLYRRIGPDRIVKVRSFIVSYYSEKCVPYRVVGYKCVIKHEREIRVY